MRYFILTLLLFICLTSLAQKFRDGGGFNSMFKQVSDGTFGGTVNGVLFCKLDNSDLILDFQGSTSRLQMIPDPDEVYDTNTKIYSGQTTSGRTPIEYSTYAWANEITIKLNDQEFEITAIDGGCDMVINGIDYYYQAEQGTEYLVLFFSLDVELTNWQSLVGDTEQPNNIDELKGKKRTLTVKRNSTLTFATSK
jgi:hypothetical protein